MESKLKCVFDLHHIEVNENSDNNKDSSLGSLPTNSTKLTEDTGIELNEPSSGNVYVKVNYLIDLFRICLID